MITQTLLTAFQIFFALLLIVFVVLQGGGAGLSASNNSTANYFASKRGYEKYLFYLTVFVVVIFIMLSIATIFVR